MNDRYKARNASALAGLAGAICCSVMWLSGGLTLLLAQGLVA